MILLKLIKYYFMDLEKATKAIQSYRPEAKGTKKIHLLNQMFMARARQQFSFEEFFLYHLDRKTAKEWKNYISDEEHFRYLSKLNKKKNGILFSDKGLTYERFKAYYKREAAAVRDNVLSDDAACFLENHSEFIVKPLTSAFGNGVLLYQKGKKTTEQVFEDLCQRYHNAFIMEEKIVQSEELGQFHPESVNTLRLTTLRLGDRIEIVHPFAKFGLGTAIVDNAAAGGVFCSIDTNTGKMTAAVDEVGNRYETHPDSHRRFEGFTIPRFDEAVALVKELADVIPDNRWTGWDLALTDDGWVMVEGNAYGQMVAIQIMEDKGIREEMDGFLAE